MDWCNCINYLNQMDIYKIIHHATEILMRFESFTNNHLSCFFYIFCSNLHGDRSPCYYFGAIHWGVEVKHLHKRVQKLLYTRPQSIFSSKICYWFNLSHVLDKHLLCKIYSYILIYCSFNGWYSFPSRTTFYVGLLF